MNIYFSGSIRGGTDLQPRYLALIEALQESGHVVLTEHIFTEKVQLTDGQIYHRDIEWIERADCMIADVTTASLGVGFEICFAALKQRIPVLCLAEGETNVSAMIQGCIDVEFKRYTNTDYAVWLAKSWLDWLANK